MPVDKNFQKLKNDDDDFACVSLYSHNCIFKKARRCILLWIIIVIIGSCLSVGASVFLSLQG